MTIDHEALTSITLLDLWTVLMRWALNDRDYGDGQRDPSLPDDVDATTPEGVADALARVVCPSGVADGVAWSRTEDGMWLVMTHASYQRLSDFGELADDLDEYHDCALSPTDPAHIALVARVCAVRLGLVATPGPVAVCRRVDGEGCWVRFTPCERVTGLLSAGWCLKGDHWATEPNIGWAVFEVLRQMVEEDRPVVTEHYEEQNAHG